MCCLEIQQELFRDEQKKKKRKKEEEEIEQSVLI